MHSYGTDVTEYLKFQGTPDNGIFLGVELEAQVDGSLSDKAEAWNEAIDGFAILKEDSSIGHGFEIVTAPCSVDVHRKEWTALLSDTALVKGLKSWNASKNSQGETACGMHVHVSRAPLSQLTIGKLLVFVNSPKNSRNIEKIAGRPSVYYSRIQEKKLTDGTLRCSDCGKIQKGKRERSYCKHCRAHTYAQSRDHNRYQAINLQNTDTIEFRLFRGTLKLEHVLANIEFCDALIRWTMQASILDCESWSVFWTYVTKHAKSYKNLIAYMGVL